MINVTANRLLVYLWNEIQEIFASQNVKIFYLKIAWPLITYNAGNTIHKVRVIKFRHDFSMVKAHNFKRNYLQCTVTIYLFIKNNTEI